MLDELDHALFLHELDNALVLSRFLHALGIRSAPLMVASFFLDWTSSEHEEFPFASSQRLGLFLRRVHL